MKRLLTLAGVLVLFGLPLLAQSMLYYSENDTLNADGSVTVSPTVSMSWDNNIDFCDPDNGCAGEADQCFVMLTGNSWKGGEVDTGDIGCGAEYTFPNVTLPANGTPVDLSYAGKVEGATTFNGNYWTEPAYTAFYNDVFVDGQEPLIAPAPCLLGGCGTPFPNPWTRWPAGYHPVDLGSLQVKQSEAVRVPTYFGPLSAEATDGGCATGYSGVFLNVHYQVLDQVGNAMQVSGVTPQEHVTRNGTPQPGYQTFSTPQTTVVDGKFDDDPVGTCFPPGTVGNPCFTVNQIFKALYNGNTYNISTTTSRRDCYLGVKDDVSLNPPGYNKTFTQGTVN